MSANERIRAALEAAVTDFFATDQDYKKLPKGSKLLVITLSDLRIVLDELDRLQVSQHALLSALEGLSGGMNEEHDGNPFVRAAEVRAARKAIAQARGN